MNQLLIFGLGYTGSAIAEAAHSAGFSVTGTSRTGTAHSIRFDSAWTAIESATHLLTTAAPGETGDPVLAHYAAAIATAPRLRWIGYLSSTVVYGDRDGGWVDEDTPPTPSQTRGQRRLDAETAWSRFAGRCMVDIFRLAGIYGPGRSAFDDLRAGRARRMDKPAHQFGRIHRDDITRAVTTAMRQDRPAVCRVLNLADDEPSESAAVVTEAAALLGVTPPPSGCVRRCASLHESDGTQLLGGKPQSRRHQDQGDAGYRVALPDLPRGLTRHPGPGARPPSAVATAGRTAATAGDRRP